MVEMRVQQGKPLINVSLIKADASRARGVSGDGAQIDLSRTSRVSGCRRPLQPGNGAVITHC